ncbi:SGNH/GDSL hydrolase family protein [Streptomyces sp. NBC_01800]|uniref:SGNH/GDSL hydrolase family protein n=1 Tax=Streptomyces sp. NBC_01800 TaxID=2975945 RepID=UPI002DDADAF3|nr:SGNH/GDSL hydrolase family protein [Streptomyces sp. NBC_01800]WSA68420.1 SGNH/GDSL hydrolase family protein [Streptomyces sp. NBC_01800]
MPRRHGPALLTALVAGTAALAAIVAFAGSALFSGGGSKQVGTESVARTPAAPAHSTGVWIGTWAGAPTAGVADTYTDDDLTRRTIRNVVHTSIGGDAARITLSNLFGTRPLLVDQATVNTRPVSFRSAPSVTIPAGGQVVSDPVVVPVAPDADLVVTLRTPTADGPVTIHPNSHQTSYVADRHGTWRSNLWRYLTAVDVRNKAAAGAIVTIGDSLTAGTGSTLDANSRWPDVLADRLRGRYAVVNQGIAGNRILRDGQGYGQIYGQRASARFDRDVLGVADVKTVIIALGVNDVQQFPQERDPQRIADALRAMTERAHDRGLHVVGATLMPFEGSLAWTPARDTVRMQVNALIRAGGIFDEVVDFDRVVRDPYRPSRLLPEFDCGDHLHLNDNGYLRLGHQVDLRTLHQNRPASDQL